MKFIVAISLLIVGFVYVNAGGVSGNTVANEVDLGVGLPMEQLKNQNAGKSDLGASVNSAKTIAKGTINRATKFFLLSKRFCLTDCVCRL